MRKLARKLGKTKTEVIKLALNTLSETQAPDAQDSVLDSLLTAGFKPLPIEIGDLAHDEKKQREFIQKHIRKDSASAIF